MYYFCICCPRNALVTINFIFQQVLRGRRGGSDGGSEVQGLDERVFGAFETVERWRLFAVSKVVGFAGDGKENGGINGEDGQIFAGNC